MYPMWTSKESENYLDEPFAVGDQVHPAEEYEEEAEQETLFEQAQRKYQCRIWIETVTLIKTTGNCKYQ